MKILIGLLLFTVVSCEQGFNIIRTNNTTKHQARVESSSVSDGRIVLAGENLTGIKSVSPTSPNLSEYKMVIESVTAEKATIKLTHPTNSVLNFAIGTVLTFIIATAHADTTINLTVDVAPTGAVMAFNLASCPAGWSAMDGTGGRPDARGRTVVGSGTGSGLTNRALATVGGSETHTLTLAQMPAHSHAATIRALADFGGTASPQGNYIASPTAQAYDIGYDSTLASDSVDVSPAGGGAAHPIMQPYVALLYCQKN